jgi:hypothetical protein
MGSSKWSPIKPLRWGFAGEPNLVREPLNKCAVADSFLCKAVVELILPPTGRGGEGKGDSCRLWRSSSRRCGQRFTANSWVTLLLLAGLGGEGEGSGRLELPVLALA